MLLQHVCVCGANVLIRVLKVKLFHSTVMSSFGLAQISEVIAHFSIRNAEEHIYLILNLKKRKQYLGKCCRNQLSLLISSYHVTCFLIFNFFLCWERQKQKDFSRYRLNRISTVTRMVTSH